MTRELLCRYPPTDGREQVGRFLRHSFPLAMDAFAPLVTETDDSKARARLFTDEAPISLT
jgi:hypothetical protein